MSWLAIVNPVSGGLLRGGRAADLAGRIEAELGIEVVFSGRPGEAEALARAASTHRGLLAVGGDGTLAQVINGMDLDRQGLALLPTGTGNGVARALGIPSPLTGADAVDWNRLRDVLQAATFRPARLDLIGLRFRADADDAWTRRLAIGTTAVGYAARVVALARGPLGRLSRRLPAAFCYPLGACLQALRRNRFDGRLAWDERSPVPRRLTNLMVQGCAYAGNFRAFPRARLDDGRMELLAADAGPIAQLRHNLAVLRQDYGYETARPMAVRRLSLTSDHPLLLMLDGELHPGVRQIEWEILPRTLEFVLPGRLRESTVTVPASASGTS